MNSAIIISTSSSNSSIKNQSVGDGVDTLIELLSTATAEQAATILTILNRGMELYKTSAEAPVEKAVKVKTVKTVKAPKKEVALPEATEGAPGAEEYRLSASDIDSSVCIGREFDGEDKRWKPIVFRESQCGSPLVAGSDLCAKCSKRAEKYAATPKPGSWKGRVTEEPLGWVHMLGTEWALEKKPRFAASGSGSGSAPTSSAASVASEAEDASDSESESVSLQTEMPATSTATASVSASAPAPAPAPSDKKAAAAAAKAQKEADKAQKLADKEAAAAQKLADKEAEKAKKLADKEAAAAKKLADAAAKKAATAAKPAKVPATSAPTSASNSASAASASEVTEVTEVSGELKLIDGTLYMVKTGNVYEYDELSEKAGDFVGRLTTDETIDTEAEEVSAVESDSE